MAAALIFSALGASKQAIHVPGWPTLPYPFSTAMLTCLSDDPKQACWLHASGMQGIDFNTLPPSMVPGGVGNQTAQTLEKIAAVAQAAGASMDDMSECEVMLANLEDFKEMNAAYGAFFGRVKPARAAAAMGLVGGALVEIKCSGFAPNPVLSRRGAALK